MNGPLVNVFVSELVKFQTGGGQSETASEAEKTPQLKTEDENSDIPKLTEDELIQLQDQMRKVHPCFFYIIFLTVTV